MHIERSPGLTTGLGFVVGGGQSGATEDLDSVVQQAAEALAAAYAMPITIRFNSNRRSGGAWLKTDDPDGIWLNAEVGITASLSQDGELWIFAHVGKRVGEYAHTHVDNIDAALIYVQTRASLARLEQL